ncbi:hypothetical protein [Heyndrickxia camelliae]|uniref:Sporulation protein n=1 Tax=Heyndrickxia camelliae TaxID=1707093 RepID=A0A2N3LF33_9BACI|nr:hypothetical protein [Heyndrickxia camelliae]PKR83226.1 hypothetical protein CWO92_20495 [Heyndrickxia camelliae]
MWKPFICILVCLIMTGCSLQNKDEKAENGENGHVKYQRLSSESPDPSRKQVDLNGQTETLGAEVNTAKRIMRTYKEYQLVSVSINGNNMWVTAHTRNRMSTHERMRREADVHKRLKKALPQYRINVKLEEK